MPLDTEQNGANPDGNGKVVTVMGDENPGLIGHVGSGPDRQRLRDVTG